MGNERYRCIYDNVRESMLFNDIDLDGFIAIMNCWQSKARFYQAGDTVVATTDPKQDFLLIVSGRAHLMQEDFLGRKTLIKDKYSGELATLGAEGMGDAGLHYMVVAATDTEILSFPYKNVVTPCEHACTYHAQLLSNLVQALLRGHYHMFLHLEQLSKRTTREKLLTYLSACAQQKNAATFDIPFSRQELADYLCVDRSAMCTELTRLVQAGIISLEGRHVTLLQHPGIMPLGKASQHFSCTVEQ